MKKETHMKAVEMKMEGNNLDENTTDLKDLFL